MIHFITDAGHSLGAYKAQHSNGGRGTKRPSERNCGIRTAPRDRILPILTRVLGRALLHELEPRFSRTHESGDDDRASLYPNTAVGRNLIRLAAEQAREGRKDRGVITAIGAIHVTQRYSKEAALAAEEKADIACRGLARASAQLVAETREVLQFPANVLYLAAGILLRHGKRVEIVRMLTAERSSSDLGRRHPEPELPITLPVSGVDRG